MPMISNRCQKYNVLLQTAESSETQKAVKFLLMEGKLNEYVNKQHEIGEENKHIKTPTNIKVNEVMMNYTATVHQTTT